MEVYRRRFEKAAPYLQTYNRYALPVSLVGGVLLSVHSTARYAYDFRQRWRVHASLFLTGGRFLFNTAVYIACFYVAAPLMVLGVPSYITSYLL